MQIDRKEFLRQSLLGGVGLGLGGYAMFSGENGKKTVPGRKYHVSVKGNNANRGTAARPLQTIAAASAVAHPGDMIIVHEGTYRERISPPRGGTSNARRIVYQTAEGEPVTIKGSEIITGWKKYKGTVWKVTIPNSFFGDYNPYKDIIAGDWFDDHGRDHHTGMVYINGKSLDEMGTLNKMLHPSSKMADKTSARSLYTWYCESDSTNTYIYANFHEYNPNKETVEINVRKSCFYPHKTGINYISVRGFRMQHAATQWAPPTAEQIGLIGTRWSKGWVIEDNIISDSRCTGVTLGKYGDKWDNTSEDTASGYVETIKRAKDNRWNKDNIGHHTVRNNEIYDCEQAGLVGSLGAIFSNIQHNDIHDVWTKRYFSGAEMAGIKIHAAIDCQIEGNRLANVGRGLWLDWMAQGTHLSRNLCYDNVTDDILVEVNHGPFIIDNNLFLSRKSISDASEGGAYTHNLIAGNMSRQPQSRKTPYFAPHSTKKMRLSDIAGGDNRFYNNIFAGNAPYDSSHDYDIVTGSGTNIYDHAKLPMHVDDNVYYNQTRPYTDEQNYIAKQNFDLAPQIIEKKDAVYLSIAISSSVNKLNTPQVTTEMLGKAIVPDQAYTYPDGACLRIHTDYFGHKRSVSHPMAGPFENVETGQKIQLKVWSNFV